MDAPKRDIFQALADPTRRGILAMLALQAMTPNALAEHFQISRQAVSKHIQVLAGAHAVKLSYRGREIHYHINAKKMQEVDQWLATFRTLWDDKFDQLDEVLKDI